MTTPPTITEAARQLCEKLLGINAYTEGHTKYREKVLPEIQLAINSATEDLRRQVEDWKAESYKEQQMRIAIDTERNQFLSERNQLQSQNQELKAKLEAATMLIKDLSIL